MPREKSTVWAHFMKGKNVKNENIVSCKYCDQSYVFPNATRMAKHLETCKNYAESSSYNKESESENLR